MDDESKKLIHKVSNLLSAIYTFGEPALQGLMDKEEALKEILKVGEEVEVLLRELKKKDT